MESTNPQDIYVVISYYYGIRKVLAFASEQDATNELYMPDGRLKRSFTMRKVKLQ
ncbi:MAG: hypothetical protein ACYCQJ_05350 [Nitrososphaerales archaeon]